jgi:tRNA-dihydrouridine synthase
MRLKGGIKRQGRCQVKFNQKWWLLADPRLCNQKLWCVTKPTMASWWQSLGSPQHVASPMVDQSELAYRMMMRRLYRPPRGADAGGGDGASGGARQAGLMCYTPMLHAAKFRDDATYRSQRFATCEAERSAGAGGLIAQFCGNDPATLVAAARLIGDRVDAVDLNLGCPENIAKKGNYGSFLLRQPDVSIGIVEAWTAAGTGLEVPVTCKIRLMDEGSPDPQQRGLQGTLNFARALEAAGASAICVHGRTRHQKGINTGSASWEAIAQVKAAVSIPVIANGGIANYQDVAACLAATGADAVMSAEALLEDPTLFNGGSSRLDVQTYSRRQCGFSRLYLESAQEFPPSDFFKCEKAHVLKFLHGLLGACAPEVRAAVMGATSSDELGVALSLLEQDIGGCADGEAAIGAVTALRGDCAGAVGGAAGGHGGDGGDEEREVAGQRMDVQVQQRSWYRRHRRHESTDVDGAEGIFGGTAAAAGGTAQTSAADWKEKRREHFRAQGYKV